MNSFISMASKNALLSLSSGVNEKYIFQAIKVTKVSDKTTRYPYPHTG